MESYFMSNGKYPPHLFYSLSFSHKFAMVPKKSKLQYRNICLICCKKNFLSSLHLIQIFLSSNFYQQIDSKYDAM